MSKIKKIVASSKSTGKKYEITKPKKYSPKNVRKVA